MSSLVRFQTTTSRAGDSRLRAQGRQERGGFGSPP
jgi:hypothetical protein